MYNVCSLSSIYSYNICYVFIVTEHRRRKSQPSSLSPSTSSEEDGGGYNNSDDEKISQQDGVDVLVSSLHASASTHPMKSKVSRDSQNKSNSILNVVSISSVNSNVCT